MQPYNSKFVLHCREPEIQAIEIDDYFRKMDSPLFGLGTFVKDCSELWKINELFIIALMALESGWGKSQIAKVKNNLCGWGAVDEDPYGGALYFHCKEGCLQTVCEGLHRLYLTKGGKYYHDGTIGSVARKYSSDPKWADKICQIMNQIRYWWDRKNK